MRSSKRIRSRPIKKSLKKRVYKKRITKKKGLVRKKSSKKKKQKKIKKLVHRGGADNEIVDIQFPVPLKTYRKKKDGKFMETGDDVKKFQQNEIYFYLPEIMSDGKTYFKINDDDKYISKHEIYLMNRYESVNIPPGDRLDTYDLFNANDNFRFSKLKDVYANQDLYGENLFPKGYFGVPVDYKNFDNMLNKGLNFGIVKESINMENLDEDENNEFKYELTGDEEIVNVFISVLENRLLLYVKIKNDDSDDIENYKVVIINDDEILKAQSTF